MNIKDRFRICYDYLGATSKPLYNKPNSLIWVSDKNIWEISHGNSKGIFSVPLTFISKTYLKRYLFDKLNRLDSTVTGVVYIPFTFIAERIKAGIMLECRDDMFDIYIEPNVLPYWLSDFNNIFPQKESIVFR